MWHWHSGSCTAGAHILALHSLMYHLCTYETSGKLAQPIMDAKGAETDPNFLSCYLATLQRSRCPVVLMIDSTVSCYSTLAAIIYRPVPAHPGG